MRSLEWLPDDVWRRITVSDIVKSPKVTTSNTEKSMSDSNRQSFSDSMPKGLKKAIYERAAQQNSTPPPSSPANTNDEGKAKQ